MDRESSCGIGMRLLPQDKTSQSYLFWLPCKQHWPWPRLLLEINPGKSTAVRRSCVPPHFYRHLPTPDPSPPSLWTASLTSGSVTGAGNGLQDRMAACRSWFTSLLQVVCLWCMCFCVAEVGFFSCSHTVLLKEHNLGLFFFSSPSSCYAVFFFDSLSSCSVYPLVIYVCCVWTGWWLISLVLVTSDNKGLLLLLLLHIKQK